jgi:hypothetical protein
VTADAPSDSGADHDTTADPFPGVARTPVGGDGTPIGVAEPASDGSDVPTAFVAVTVKE